MPSWSEIVVPHHLREKKEGKKEEVKQKPLLCTTCRRRNAIVCEDCKKRPIYQPPYCGGCYVDRIWRTLGSDSMCIGYIRASNPANDPPLECQPCKNARDYSS